MERDLNKLEEKLGKDKVKQSVDLMGDFMKASMDLAKDMAGKKELTAVEGHFIESLLLFSLDTMMMKERIK